MEPLILCAAPMPPAVAERAQREFGAVLSQDDELDTAALLKGLADHPSVRALLVSTRIKIPASVMAQLPAHLQVLATCSVGVDHIDLDAARQRGLPVTNTPDVLTDATADLTLLLMLGAARRLREYVQIMDEGWRHRYNLGQMLGFDLTGKTLGIVGMGRIGQAVAQRARAFGMRIAYHNRRRLSPEQECGAHYCATLDELLPLSQVLSLNAPAGGPNDGMLNRRTLALLPRGAMVVNTARGQLIDEDALVEALQSGQVGSAGLDVFQAEPDYDLRLRDFPQVLLAPHMGSATIETRDAMGMLALDNIADVLAGRAPRTPA